MVVKNVSSKLDNLLCEIVLNERVSIFMFVFFVMNTIQFFLLGDSLFGEIG